MYRIDNLHLEGFSNIVIQFPSDQLKQAQQVWKELQHKYPEKKFVISADPLHSSCCVNIIGAMHIQHDLIIHFGEACFSEPISNNIQYALPYIEYDIEKLQSYLENLDDQYCILFDQPYDHVQILNSKHIVLQQQQQNEKLQHIACGYYAPEMKTNFIFIGSSESELLSRFLLHFDHGLVTKCLVIDPITRDKQNYQINQMALIMKRSKQVEEASQCNCFGILINNPTAEYTKNAYSICKQILKQNKKKWFTFSMNSLNEAKLGNFPEIEAYIIISCYRNSIIDTKQYYKLIITPFQLLQAFSKVQYKVESDLHLIQPQNNELHQVIQQNNEEQQPPQESTALLSMNNNGQLIALDQIFQSLDFYKNRAYQGLEIKKNLDPAKLEIGLTGIASHYEKEGNK